MPALELAIGMLSFVIGTPCPEGDWGSTWTERLARIGRLPPKPNVG